MISALREWLYREGMLRTTDLPAFVISVGNISMGGTGKSPLTILLAEWGVANGFRTAVLSRGYKRKVKDLMIVRPHENLPGPDALGDEPWMIKNRVPGISLLVHPDRGRMAKRHWQDLGSPELVILDDGFQHWRISRDRDLVLVDAKEGIAGKPLGFFREPATALRRADLVMLTQANAVDAEKRNALLGRIRNLLESRRRPLWKRGAAKSPLVLSADYEFEALTDGKGRATEMRPGTEFLLVSGIAKPDRFREMARSCELPVKEEMYFPDHHALRPKQRERILSSLGKLSKGALLLTEKDWARWRESLAGAEIFVLRVKFQISDSAQWESFLAEVKGEIQRCSISG